MTYFATQATDTLPDPPMYGPTRELIAEVRSLSALVGELTIALVVQGAYLSAARAQRPRPNEYDVDEALSVVADNVPEHVADSLWGARETLIARFRCEPGSVAPASPTAS